MTLSTERSGSLYSIKASFNLLVWPSPEEPRQICVLFARKVLLFTVIKALCYYITLHYVWAQVYIIEYC